MPKRLSLQPHLSRDELERRDRTAKDPVSRSPWQMVGLLAQGHPSEQVAAVTGSTAHGVRTMAQRDTQQGPAGLGDRRHRHPGAAGLLSAAQRAELARALDRPPADGGRWTGPKVAAWMAPVLGPRSSRREAGNCCAALGGRRRCLGPAMPRLIRVRQRLVKKSAGRRARSATGFPAGPQRALGD